ncbi:MAG: redoxin domain-containing protein, partial [Terriglobia bacterium]
MAKRAGAAIGVLILVCLTMGTMRAADKPLSQDDVTLLLLGGATTEKMLTLIEQRGVDFRMTPDLAKRFHDAGADDIVIEALQKAGAKVQPATVATPPAPPASNQGQASSSQSPAATPTTPPPTTSEASAGDEHPLAPAFSLVDLSGQRLDLADYKGQVVLLNFWATWCPRCRAA